MASRTARLAKSRYVLPRHGVQTHMDDSTKNVARDGISHRATCQVALRSPSSGCSRGCMSDSSLPNWVSPLCCRRPSQRLPGRVYILPQRLGAGIRLRVGIWSAGGPVSLGLPGDGCGAGIGGRTANLRARECQPPRAATHRDARGRRPPGRPGARGGLVLFSDDKAGLHAMRLACCDHLARLRLGMHTQ